MSIVCVCEVTVKFNIKDAEKTHTKTFTSYSSDWTRVHEMVREYTEKHFDKDEVISVQHLNHSSYNMDVD